MLISRNVYDPGMARFPGNTLARTIGFYGHLPKFYNGHASYVGYFAFVGPRHRYTLWYMGNTFRPGKIIERHKSGTIVFRNRVVNRGRL